MARVIPSNLLQLRTFGAAAYVCLALAASASAQEMDTRVIVPESPGGANFAGCYRADQGPLWSQPPDDVL